MKLLTLVFAAAALSAFGDVRKGENILLNGIFEADQSILPSYWISQTEDAFPVHTGGGPDGKPFISVKSANTRNGEVSLRQYGLLLSSNGTYRISAMVRTKGFSARNIGIGVANAGWFRGRDAGKVPADTNGEWVRLSNVFKGFESKDGTYFCYIYATSPTGSLDIADISLSAEDDVACRETSLSGSATEQVRPRLIPMSPLLWRIPKDNPVVDFQFFGELPGGDFGDYDAVLRADGSNELRIGVLNKGLVRLALPKGADKGFLTVSIVRRSDKQELFSERRTFRTVDLPQNLSPRGHRRLNNFTTEVLAKSLVTGLNRFPFTTLHDGWVYVSVRALAGDGFRAALDGSDIMDRSTPHSEAFRFLPAGEHSLEVDHAGAGAVVVRSIAETFNYCPCANSKVQQNPNYDWAYQVKYALKAVTTENGGAIPDPAVKELHDAGRIWLANLGTTDKSAADLSKLLSKCVGLNLAKYDGVTCDEQAFVKPDSIYSFTQGLKDFDFRSNPEKLIYVWAIGRPSRSAIDVDFINTCINASRGRGKVMMEAYLGTQTTEDEARKVVQVNVIDRIRRFRELNPISIRSIGMALGNFNQVPILSIAHHPEVDYKYYLDLQLNMVANDPACRGLGTIGYWGSYYADDELHRWSYELLRHYVVEGNREMLSEAFGYKYLPGLIQNGDFRKTLEPWAVTGNVRTDEHATFAVRSQNRWYSRGGVGDTFAVLTREPNSVATLSQTARGLKPGRTYCLQFATFDVKDVKANRIAPRRFGIRAKLSSGAEIDKDLSWGHVDTRVKGRYANNNGVARINLQHIVFKATAPEVTVTLDNAASEVGEELGVNYLSLNPYFPPER